MIIVKIFAVVVLIIAIDSVFELFRGEKP